MGSLKPAVYHYPDRDGLSQALADEILKLVRKARSDGRSFYMALSGGSTPRKLFEEIAVRQHDPGFWSHVHLFWVDERCVPPDHPESNFGMTNDALLAYLDLPEDQIFRMHGEALAHKEALRYEALLKSSLPQIDGWPAFDLVMLGMGTDGHTASIFPDRIDLIDSARCCEVSVHPDLGQERITLTGRVINHARIVFFLVTGIEKSSLVAHILNEDPEAKSWPASYIRPLSGNLAWFLDEAAAGGIS